MKYYSIRVVEAENYEEAVRKVEDGDFDESDSICDRIYPEEEVTINYRAITEPLEEQKVLNDTFVDFKKIFSPTLPNDPLQEDRKKVFNAKPPYCNKCGKEFKSIDGKIYERQCNCPINKE